MFFLHTPREHEASADIKVDSGRTNQSSLFLQLIVLLHLVTQFLCIPVTSLYKTHNSEDVCETTTR